MFENFDLKKARNSYEASENAIAIIKEILRSDVLYEVEDLEGLCNIIRGLAHQSIKDAYALYCITTMFVWYENILQCGAITIHFPDEDELNYIVDECRDKKEFRKCLKGAKIKIKFQVGDYQTIYKF